MPVSKALLRADDDARAGLGQREEGALALDDLGQHLAPALVGAPACASRSRRRAGCRRASGGPAPRPPASTSRRRARCADAVERGDQERLHRHEVDVGGDALLPRARDQRAVDGAGEARALRRGLGELHFPLRRRAAPYTAPRRWRASASHCSSRLQRRVPGRAACSARTGRRARCSPRGLVARQSARQRVERGAPFRVVRLDLDRHDAGPALVRAQHQDAVGAERRCAGCLLRHKSDTVDLLECGFSGLAPARMRGLAQRDACPRRAPLP